MSIIVNIRTHRPQFDHGLNKSNYIRQFEQVKSELLLLQRKTNFVVQRKVIDSVTVFDHVSTVFLVCKLRHGSHVDDFNKRISFFKMQMSSSMAKIPLFSHSQGAHLQQSQSIETISSQVVLSISMSITMFGPQGHKALPAMCIYYIFLSQAQKFSCFWKFDITLQQQIAHNNTPVRYCIYKALTPQIDFLRS